MTREERRNAFMETLGEHIDARIAYARRYLEDPEWVNSRDVAYTASKLEEALDTLLCPP